MEFNQNVDDDKSLFGPESNVGNLLSKPFGMFSPAVSIIDALSHGHQLLQEARLKTAPALPTIGEDEANDPLGRIFI